MWIFFFVTKGEIAIDIYGFSLEILEIDFFTGQRIFGAQNDLFDAQQCFIQHTEGLHADIFRDHL